MGHATPREEFEEQFGEIIDEQWQWLKEFVERNLPVGVIDWNNVAGFEVQGRVFHPSEVVLIRNTRREQDEWDIDLNVPMYTRDYLEMLRTQSPELTPAQRIERVREINKERRTLHESRAEATSEESG